MLIAGVDEAGRGPLAGPVISAAVILNPRKPIAGLQDSKELTPKHLLTSAIDSCCQLLLRFFHSRAGQNSGPQHDGDTVSGGDLSEGSTYKDPSLCWAPVPNKQSQNALYDPLVSDV